MKYTIDSAGIHFADDEIPMPEAVAEMERISAQLNAALMPDLLPTDEQRERIKARIMKEVQTVNHGI